MGRYAKQFAYAILPTSALTDSFGASAANTGGLDLNSFMGFIVAIKVTEDAALRAAASATAATAADYPFTADRDYFVSVTTATRYVSVFGLGTSGSIYVAKASGI